MQQGIYYEKPAPLATIKLNFFRNLQKMVSSMHYSYVNITDFEMNDCFLNLYVFSASMSKKY